MILDGIFELWGLIVSWFHRAFHRDTPRPLLKEGVDYTFIEIQLDEPVDAIKITKGPFADVVYYYGGVKIIPESNVNRLAYQYTIWDSAGHPKQELISSSEFQTYIGDILVSIITDEQNKGVYAAPRIDDPQEFDS
jgi:hypothetical protein